MKTIKGGLGSDYRHQKDLTPSLIQFVTENDTLAFDTTVSDALKPLNVISSLRSCGIIKRSEYDIWCLALA